MFESYAFRNLIGASCYWVDILDSDFQEAIDLPWAPEEDSGFTIPAIVAQAIIKIYSKRNLNVALNLAEFISLQEHDFEDQLNEIESYNILDFNKYIPDIRKYKKCFILK